MNDEGDFFMPRIARIYLEEGIFHILTRGNNRQWIFKDEQDFLRYLLILKELKIEHPFQLYHYCLMNNHVHLILEVNPKTELSKFMKRLNLSYYHYYKKRYGYSGHFWEDRYKSLLIEKENYLLACGLYVERNPVRARMVKKAEKYPYSSYSYYAQGKKDGLMDRNIYYDDLGKTEEERRKEYCLLSLPEEKDITEKVFNRLFLGSDDFVQKMEKKFQVDNIRLKRGRPRKK